MRRKAVRVYADTSVFGGAFDEEFRQASRSFLDRVRIGRFHLVTSAIVLREIQPAPEKVRELFTEMLERADIAPIDEDARSLQQAYLEAEIVSERWRNDALHVAVATVANCSAIVSWNFKHIVHFQKIPLYNAVNVLHGYGEIAIHSPLELPGDEDQEEIV